MQSAEIQAWMREAASEVLETMCYMQIVGPLEGKLDGETDWVSTTLKFRGGPSGVFGVSAPYAVARTMACNLLGEDEAEGERQRVADAVGEISNMICGGFVRHFGKESVFDLTHPISDFALTAPEPSAVVAWLQADEGPIGVWATVE